MFDLGPGPGNPTPRKTPGWLICQRCGASLTKEQTAYEYRESTDWLVLRCADHQMCERWRAHARVALRAWEQTDAQDGVVAH